MNAHVAILGLLVEQPLHGYGIEQLIEERGMRNWTSIGFSSIYAILDRLVDQGWAVAETRPAPGRGKERRVHRITSEGRKEWTNRALQYLSNVESSPEEFLTAFSGIPHLKQSDLVGALTRRVQALRSRVDDLERDLRAVRHARSVPPHVGAMFDYTRHHLEAEADWLDTFLESYPFGQKEGSS